MKKTAGIAAIILIMMGNAYADEVSGVQQGTEQYNWQVCINAKTSECLNTCINSSDIDCSDNCDDLAKAKCQSQGVTPPA